jgi:ligand-binding sensor domain-containing protein/AraC-like DNA-binding protein
MSRRLKIIYALISALLSISGYGRERVFCEITTSDGLSDNLVNLIYRDSTGFVWIGTDNALNRFDGVNIKKFYFDDSSNNKRVTSITEVGDEDLYVGNGAGLWRLNKMSGIMKRVVPEMIDMPVYTLMFDKKETLYAGTEKGLFSLNVNNVENAVKQILIDENVLSASNKIKSILQDKTGKIRLATSKGLFSYSPDSREIEKFPYPATSAREDAYQTMTAIDNMLYLGTETQGIFIFDIDNQTFSKFMDVGSNVVSSLSSDGMDLLYISTDGNGICCVSRKENRILWRYRHDSRDIASIRSNSVYSLLVDNKGIIWTGYYSAGLDYTLFQSDMFDIYDFPPSFDSYNMTVRSFCMREGEKLIGTRDGLYFINEKTGETKSFRDGILRSNLILSVAFYNNNYYAGTYGGGLYVLNPETLILSEFASGTNTLLSKIHIFCLLTDRYDNLWMGTSEGVFCYNAEKETVINYNSANSKLPEGLVYEIFFDSTDKGWFCTQTGVSIFDRQTGVFKTNMFPENFPANDDYRMVFEDTKKNLYLLPNKGNIVKTNIKISEYQIFMNDNFADYSFNSMIEDEHGDIWIGSDKGLIRISGNDSIIYGISDGLPDQLFLTKAMMRDKNDILWLGNNKGLVMVGNEKIDSLSNSRNKLIFTDVFLSNSPLDENRAFELLRKGILKLKKNENTITLCFSDLMYNDPKAALYEYKVEGLDNNWTSITGKNGVTLYDLKSGKYVFRVRSLKNAATETSVNIRVGRSYAWLIWVALLFALSILLLFSLKRMAYLYRKIKSSEDESITEQNVKDKYRSNRLSDAECKDLLSRLNAYMKLEKPYIDSELKLSDISGVMKVSSPSLSFFFNQYLHQSFHDYVNEFRVEEFRRLISKKKNQGLTLSALSEQCGFSSRSSFFRSFKKIVGITPNEYINSAIRRGIFHR